MSQAMGLTTTAKNTTAKRGLSAIAIPMKYAVSEDEAIEEFPCPKIPLLWGHYNAAVARRRRYRPPSFLEWA
jgi:hypothetical protein